MDSCGNLANIYDASEWNNDNYWAEVKTKRDSCDLNSQGAESCGNCDYFSGSTCKEYDNNKDKNPSYGENICRNLECEYPDIEGNKIKKAHGETWCANAQGVSEISIDSENNEITSSGEDLPGGRYFRMVCYNGEISVEPCADYRQEICIESDINGFSTAACRVNKWEGCLGQDNKEDCEDTDALDCQWMNTGNLKENLSDDDKEELNNFANKWGENANLDEKYFQHVCAPKYSPGFDFWKETTDAAELCSVANFQGIVTYRQDTLNFNSPTRSLEDCENGNGNCQLLTKEWKETKQNFCSALGDCGSSINYIHEEGKSFWEEFFEKTDYKPEEE